MPYSFLLNQLPLAENMTLIGALAMAVVVLWRAHWAQGEVMREQTRQLTEIAEVLRAVPAAMAQLDQRVQTRLDSFQLHLAELRESCAKRLSE